MRRVAALVVVPLLLLSVLPVGGSTATPCVVSPFIGGTKIVRAAPDEWLRVTFAVDAPATGWFWSAVSFHEATTGAPPVNFGFAAERAAAVGFMETASGAPVGGPGGVLTYPYGAGVVATGEEIRIEAFDAGTCGAIAGGDEHALAPGTYAMTVLAATDTSNGAAAFLPSWVRVLDVARGPSEPIREDTLECTVGVRAAAFGVSSAALVGCGQEFEAAGRAYHGVFVGRFPDPTHTVRWVPPVGQPRQVGFFDAAVEPAGSARLDVPRYVTPVGHPFFLPTPGALSSDSGVFGIFADA